MFNPAVYENSPAAGHGVLEIAPPAGKEERSGPRRFVPLRRTEVQGTLAGPLADLRLVQHFGYTRAQSTQTIEALYRFPLPGDAAVTGVTVRFGATEIRAHLQSREAAEAAYAAAKQEGRAAALATRESPDVFTLQVAGLRPDEDVTVETSFVALARAEGLRWSLRIPLTTAPRYVRADETGTPQAQGQPLALLRDPGHRFALDVRLLGARDAASPTHAIDAQQEDGALRVRLRDGDVLPDRDFLLTWLPEQAEDRPTLRAYAHTDGGDTYFLAHVAPPALRPARPAPAREIVLLVDHSGSMTGPKWAAADWAVERFLHDLTPRDAFALAWFSDKQGWFDAALLPAGEGNTARAVEWLKGSRTSGGTELGVVLEQAVHLARGAGEQARHILVITDAEVSDAARILRLADDEYARADRRRISVLCIDAAPNSYLALELAERGGGVARFLTSAPTAADISTALDEVLADWAEPLLVNLGLLVSAPQVEAAGRAVRPGPEAGWSAVDLGDLPAGRALWVAGRARGVQGSELALRVQTGSGQTVAEGAIPLPAPEVMPALKALFGARRVTALEHLVGAGRDRERLADQLRRLGYDPARVLDEHPAAGKVYAENARRDAAAALRGLLIDESLVYGLASSAVGFIAERSEAGEKVSDTVLVANALPSGWSEKFLSGTPQPMMAAMPQASPGANFLRAAASPAPPKHSAPPSPAGLPMPDAGPVRRPPAPAPLEIFSGAPDLRGGEAVLHDAPLALPAGAEAVIGGLTFKWQGEQADLPRDLELLLFVGDPVAPRARMRLADLARAGRRPLNLLYRMGEPLRVVLAGPAPTAPALPLPAFKLSLTL